MSISFTSVVNNAVLLNYNGRSIASIVFNNTFDPEKDYKITDFANTIIGVFFTIKITSPLEVSSIEILHDRDIKIINQKKSKELLGSIPFEVCKELSNEKVSSVEKKLNLAEKLQHLSEKTKQKLLEELQEKEKITTKEKEKEKIQILMKFLNNKFLTQIATEHDCSIKKIRTAVERYVKEKIDPLINTEDSREPPHITTFTIDLKTS